MRGDCIFKNRIFNHFFLFFFLFFLDLLFYFLCYDNDSDDKSISCIVLSIVLSMIMDSFVIRLNLIILLLLLINSLILLSKADNDAKRLLDHLLNNYDKVARPVLEANERIDLYLGIKLSQIADIVRNVFYSFVC
jgi:hypothetical protein